jgi:hypothetical protein
MRISRTFAPLLLVAIGASAFAAAPAGPPRQDTRWLRGGQCLDPAYARGFVGLDHRRVLVDGGRNRYLIEVAQSCWNLDFASAIGFRGDPVSGKVCGGVLEAILVRGEPPCRIERMEVLSKAQYKAALDEREEQRRAKRAERKAAKQAAKEQQ